MTESTVTDVKLKDGNRLIHVRAGLPVAFISVWFDVGARHDPPGKEGLAHLVEHLFMKTTPRFPREELMLNHLASQGLRYNATTSMHRMFFRYRCDDARTVSAIPDFLETLATSRVNEEMFRTEKEVIKDERAMRYSQPARRLYELSKQGLYPNHALSRSVLGSEESVATITMEDVNGFLDARIRNAPPIFVVVSDESTESIIASFGDYTSAAW
jgi:zinc protease